MSTEFRETVAWLYGLEAKQGMDFRLERLTPVLGELDSPHLAFPAIHIAGTNGKGSTATMLDRAYRSAGVTTGLYTSPHLLSIRERIRTNGEPVREEDFVVAVDAIREAMAACAVALTFFEITTLAAFWEFRRRGVDLAIIEAGLGGRLDATNVVDTVAAVITTVGLDHTEYLGDTVAQIAAEKAGIIRSAAPVVTGALSPEAEAEVAVAVELHGAPWSRLGQDFDLSDSATRMDPSMLGSVGEAADGIFRHNEALARRVLEMLQSRFPVSVTDVEAGVLGARPAGRMELVAGRPPVLLDVAHNPDAAAVLASAIERIPVPGRKRLVFGVMADKDWPSMLDRLHPVVDTLTVVPVAQARALDPAELAVYLADAEVEVAPSAVAGLSRVKQISSPDDLVIVAGSVFLIAEVYRAAGGTMPGALDDVLAA